MDTFAVGAILAIAIRSPNQASIGAARVRRFVSEVPLTIWLAAGSLGFIAVLRGWGTFGADLPTAGYTAIVIGFGALLCCVLIADSNAPIRRLLRLSILQSIGRYSYAIYLFHIPLFSPAQHLGLVCERFGGALALVVWSFISYVMAAASWRFVEEPALHLKVRFP